MLMKSHSTGTKYQSIDLNGAISVPAVELLNDASYEINFHIETLDVANRVHL